MPIYAYKCESCGFAKDVLQKLSDPQLTDCPSCGAAVFRKQLTTAGFQLKGSGWYATDFKDAGAATPAAAPAAPDSAAAAAPAAVGTQSGESAAAKPASNAAPAVASTAGCSSPCA